jgi:hypothetical protein
VCQKLTGLVKNGLSKRVWQVQLSSPGLLWQLEMTAGKAGQIDAGRDRNVSFLFDVNGVIAYFQARLGWTGVKRLFDPNRDLAAPGADAHSCRNRVLGQLATRTA